ncbi:MAG: type II CRISPR RNA-guided endonuclease Cas9, partial [Treponemataceae bacterium]
MEKQQAIKSDSITKIEDTLKIATTNNPNDWKFQQLRTDNLIDDFLRSEGFMVAKNKKLYHPSDVEFNLKYAEHKEDGKKYLSSPLTASVKNPVAMRALHQLRKLINYLIKTEQIDSATRIHIELAKEVNDKNKRKAISDFQKENEKKNNIYRDELIKLAKEAGQDISPTDIDIKKYRLWTEQEKQCPYTGKTIKITDLFGETPLFDFEHTIPRSLSYDDSLENLMLCEVNFNRNVKKQKMPSELANYSEILQRVGRYYEDEISNLLGIIEKNKIKGGYIAPEQKDKKIVARHKAKMHLDYFKGKLKRFQVEELTGGFKHSQLNDTRIITKLALQYLKKCFDYVQPINGVLTDEFKKQWGIMQRNEAKDR